MSRAAQESELKPPIPVGADCVTDRSAPSGSDRTDESRSFLKNVLSNWAGEGVITLSGFILPRLINDRMSQDELGIWDFGWAIRSYISLAISNLGSSTGHYVARYCASKQYDRLNRTLGATLGLTLLAVAVGVCLTCVVAAYAGSIIRTDSLTLIHSAQAIVLTMGLSACIATPTMIYAGILTGHRRFDLLNLVDSLSDVFVVLTVFACVFTGAGLAAMGFCVFARTVINGFGKAWIARRVAPEIHVRPRFCDVTIFGEILGFSAKTMMDAIARVLQNQTAVLVIGSFLGPAAIAVYSRSAALILISTRFVMGFARVLVPAASARQSQTDCDGLARIVIQGTKLSVLLALVPGIFLFILGDSVLSVWMGANYAESPVLRILVLGYLPLLFQQGTYHILLGTASHGRVAFASLISAGVGVGLSMLFVWVFHWGIAGAALATAIPLGLTNTLVVPVIGYRIIGSAIPRFFMGAYVLPLLSSIPYVLILLLIRYSGFSDVRLQVLSGAVFGLPVMLLAIWLQMDRPRPALAPA